MALRHSTREYQPRNHRSPTTQPATHPRPVSPTYSVIRSERSTDRQQLEQSTTGAFAPKEIHQMSRNSSTMTAELPAALHPATLRTSLTLVVIAAFVAFAVRAAGLTFGF